MLSCTTYICPVCPATALEGAANVLLPPIVTKKLLPSAMSIAILVASVNVVIGLYALADVPTFKEPASIFKSPRSVALDVTDTLG